MGALSPTHWLIVVGVLVLLFGAKKLPDMARSVGQSARVLKGELGELKNDNPAPGALPGTTPPAVPTEVARRTDVPRQ